jgi:hypothetical protein
MTAEPDDVDGEFESWPAVDPVRDAIGCLVMAIIEGTETGSVARRRAMSEALTAHERIIDAMRNRPQLH